MSVHRAVEAASKVEGWMAYHELAWLATQACEKKLIIEIGSWMGRSTKAMAMCTPGVIFAVDSWKAGKDPEQVYAAFLKNVGPEIRLGKVVPIRMTASDAAVALKHVLAVLGNKLADMVFIDGNHKTEYVRDDIRNYLPLVAPKGLLCGHDFQHGPVQTAVKERFPNVEVAPKTTIWKIRKD